MKVPPSAVVRHIIMANNLADDPTRETPPPAWPIFYGFEPDSPSDSITVYDTTPVMDAVLLSGRRFMRWGIQVRIRVGMKKYDDGWNKAKELAEFLETVSFQPALFETEEYRVRHFSELAGPQFIGRERDQKRPIFTLNMIANLALVGSI